jgi:hypothetical protein
MLLKYWHDPANNVTWISNDQFRQCWPGKPDYKFIHEHYDQIVFEIIPSEEIMALPVKNDQEEE